MTWLLGVGARLWDLNWEGRFCGAAGSKRSGCCSLWEGLSQSPFQDPAWARSPPCSRASLCPSPCSHPVGCPSEGTASVFSSLQLYHGICFLSKDNRGPPPRLCQRGQFYSGWLLGSRSLWLAVQRLEHTAAVCRLLWGRASQRWAGCSGRERAGPDGGTLWASSRGSEWKHIRNPIQDERTGLDPWRQLPRNSSCPEVVKSISINR